MVVQNGTFSTVVEEVNDIAFPVLGGSRSVLVIMNRFQGLEERIPGVLRELGYAAKWCDARTSNSFLAKALLRADISQRVRAFNRANVKRIVREARLHEADTLLLISPENLRSQALAWLHQELPNVKILLYLFDSSKNRYLDQQMIDSVDVAYSFDIDDCNKFANLVFVPLPHQHHEFETTRLSEVDYNYDLCFVGTVRARRLAVLSSIARKAKRQGKSYFFYLYAPSLVQYLTMSVLARLHRYDGVLSLQSIPFEDYLTTLATSACVVDIEQTGQAGLTIRTMDAVFAGQPFVTTNRNVIDHDFYPHFPISVFSDTEPDIEVPDRNYSPSARHYFAKYHIRNWMRVIMSGEVEEYRLCARQASRSTKHQASLLVKAQETT